MASSRTILVAGAGIGGLTASLALAARGFRVVVLEQASRLEETGAGIQLSPNASRVLIRLGLAETLAPVVCVPDVVRVRKASSGRDIVTLPIGRSERYYGAPYWTVHRGDLQAALLAKVRECGDIEIKLGARVDEFAIHPNGVTVAFSGPTGASDVGGIALIGADGLRSQVREKLGDARPPRPAGRAAWRTLLPVQVLAPELRTPSVNLWIGRGAHLVHYPVRGGELVNIVAIATDDTEAPGWSSPASSGEVLQHFPENRWPLGARALIARPERWLRWTLYDRPPLKKWGRGPVTLLGDAAHPMLPFLAQGAAMAIEDAIVLADALAKRPEAPAAALRAYERARRPRDHDVQRAARRNDRFYHLGGPMALARDLVMRVGLGGELMLARYDWIYDWQPPADVLAPEPAPEPA
ncbi:Salicylate hydroxylase [Rhodovulum sp. PH10]|uniref:FAD-dependent monooxygenase n=1 Tax=Rhodovulum sp. PH10 TaxID=1187851 RepID=UPI00027C2C2B|nr:FAD-dependent monooxygenase [Rhodovulum sp. PH10]EJW11647.1 Salicylate hydroxylase [Rhodovulum sp. PH10]